MIPGLLVTGTIAAGKTSVAEAVSEQLHRFGLRHALIDFDWLGQLYPPPDLSDPYNDALAIKNLAAVWANFQAAGAS